MPVDEKVRWRKGKLRVFVRVPKSNVSNGWRLKAVVYLEEVFGRKLTNSERNRIAYLDGNPVNCEPGNVYVADPCIVTFACQRCGKILCKQQYQIKNDNIKMCLRCTVQITAKPRCVTLIDASLIKSLLARGVSVTWVSSWFPGPSSSLLYLVRCGELWKGVVPMPETETWKVLLLKVRKLTGQSGGILYKRVTMLKTIYEDQAYVAQMRSEGKSPLQELNQELHDTSWGLDRLMVMLRKFPQEKQWKTMDLRVMHDEAMRPAPSARPTTSGATSQEDGSTETLSWKQKYLAMQRECENLRRENESLRREVANLKEILTGRQATA